ncbi:cache domain-containing sensor histidine kinase [Paenibacillus agricola]|uniref:histidine kinase n=1 Tax=Paenibacillus agricola TaxID=2716264 RepID=A0ABX0J7L1_9BACL|nr:sensor histidine kinase [Paenibacillus agricola]NHN32360.1 histidine kinase [Paenibacillus agricola]
MNGKLTFDFLHFKSIQSTMAVAFSCLILFTTLFIAYTTYTLSTNAAEQGSREHTSQLMEQVNTNIETYISYMENISQMVFSNYDVRDYLKNPTLSGVRDNVDLEQRISSQLSSVLNTRKDISSILIFDNNGGIVPYNDTELNPFADPTQQSWYKKAIEANGNVVISSPHVQNVIREYNWVVSLSRQLSDVDGKRLGVLLVDLNYNVINDLCSKIKLGKKGYIFILDQEGNIVYHPQQQLIYSNLKQEQIEQVMSSQTGGFTTSEGQDSRMYTINQSIKGWKIVGVTYVDELVSNKKEIQTYIVMWGIGLIGVAILISLFLSSRISRPIKQLETSMKEVEKGNFDIQVVIESRNEIGQLSKRFNRMTTEIKELMSQNVTEQELKRKSELKALQAQINPHFLYNTLDSIIWMAEGKKSEEVVLMVSALAKLFRLSISKGQEVITIANEMEHIKSYLTIQKIRYKDKLDFEIAVNPQIVSNKVLKIILQPLVENAIYHGIKNNAGVGTIRITGEIIAHRIRLQVIDNGIGMSPESVQRMFEKNDNPSSGSGIGVSNVNQRIQLYYGAEYGITFESEWGQGTTANIWLPILK